MTLIRHTTNRRAMQALSLIGLGAAVAVMLSGCGGASTNGSPLAPTPDSGPVIYGLNALAIDSGNATGETSGLSFTDANGTETGAIIGATAYNTLNGAGPIPEYQGDFPNTGTTPPSSPGLPLGFAVGGVYYNVGSPVAAIPTNYTGNLTFGAYVSTGALNNRPVDLNTTSIVLTSSEAPGFSQPLTFDPNFGSGVLAQAQYKTAAFPLPAFLETTGLHNLHTTVSDVSGQSSTTDFSVVSLAPTDSAVLTPVLGAKVPTGEPAKSTATINTITATITNALTGVATRVALDSTNTLVLFAAPGSQTITVTANVSINHPDGTTDTFTQIGTETDTLVAGQVFIGAGITVAGNTPATPVASAHPRLRKR